MFESTQVELKREYNEKVNKVLLSFFNMEVGIEDVGNV
jgi:hypothetical protein